MTIIVPQSTFLFFSTFQISLLFFLLLYFSSKNYMLGIGVRLSVLFYSFQQWDLPIKYLFIVKHTLTYNIKNHFKTEILFKVLKYVPF